MCVSELTGLTQLKLTTYIIVSRGTAILSTNGFASSSVADLRAGAEHFSRCLLSLFGPPQVLKQQGQH